jgi:hypothetical protein
LTYPSCSLFDDHSWQFGNEVLLRNQEEITTGIIEKVQRPSKGDSRFGSRTEILEPTGKVLIYGLFVTIRTQRKEFSFQRISAAHQ